MYIDLLKLKAYKLFENSDADLNSLVIIIIIIIIIIIRHEKFLLFFPVFSLKTFVEDIFITGTLNVNN